MHFTPYAWNADRHRDVHGTTTVRLRSRWHNWLDEQRTWRAIEIAPAMRGGRQFRVAKAPYLLEAPLFADGEAQFQSTNLYDIWKKQHRADFPAGIVKRYPSAAKVRGEALAASVLYSGAFPALSADRLIQFSTQCVRDLVVFYQQPAGDGPVEIPVEIEFGSLPILESRGRGRQAVEGDFRKERSFRHGLTFTTSRFRGVQIEPPQAWDSSGKRISITLAGRVVGNRFVGRKVIPRSFFRDAVYPVYADTTETFYPSPDAAATTIDGVVSRLTVSGESWASLQGGNGTTQNSTNTSMDALLYPINQVPVGIKHCHAFTIQNVLSDEIEEQGALARATRTDDMSVPCALFGRQANRSHLAGMFVLAKQQTLSADDLRCRFRFHSLPDKYW